MKREFGLRFQLLPFWEEKSVENKALYVSFVLDADVETLVEAILVQSFINNRDPIGLFPSDAASFDEYKEITRARRRLSMKDMILGLWGKTIIIPVLATVCYFFLIYWVWNSVGWSAPGSHVFGILVFFASCVGCPLWAAYHAWFIQRNNAKFTRLTLLLMAIFLALFIYFSDYTWAHGSGYIRHYHDSVTLFVVMAMRIFEMVLGLVICLIFYKRLSSRIGGRV